MTSSLTVGIAQSDARLGAVAANVRHHLEWIEQARARGVELLVFPELSLTGYRLLHLTGRVAVQPADSDLLSPLLAASRDMTLVIGLVEDDGHGGLYNSVLLLSEGRIRHVHRKLYLPTYGIFQEGRFFSPGSRLAPVPLWGGLVGLLVCEDLWHPHLARGLARAGVKLIVVTSASPGRLGPDRTPESQDQWEALARSTALVNTSWVVYCNRVGWEEGSFYTGGSLIVRPGGEIASRAPFLDESLMTMEIDLLEADRLRWRLPLLQAQRSDIEGAP